MGGMLNRKALLLAKIETTSGTDAVPTAAANAVLIMNPEYSVDPKLLPRNFVSPTLSPNPSLIGRKLAKLKFDVDLRGNGKQNSGVLTDQPMLATLMDACGYNINTIAAATQLGFYADSDNPAASPTISFANGTAPTTTVPIAYTLTVTTGGASGTAQWRVTSNNAADTPSATPITMTSGTAVTLGTLGGTVTPTFTGTMVVGQKWRIIATPKGLSVVPLSSSFNTVTLYFHIDGLRWRLTGAQGTFSIKCPAGDLPVVTFEFTGNYNAAEDSALPASPVYETTIPSQVQLATLTYQSNASLDVSEFDFDAGSKVVPRTDVNSSDGYNGVRITERATAGSFKPEAELEGTQSFWADFAAAKTRFFFTRVGSAVGNTVSWFGPAVQAQSQSIGDKDGIAEYDIKLSYTRGPLGDDEVTFLFT